MKAGPGRPKGAPNKLNGDIKDMIRRIAEYVDTAITIPALVDEIWGSDKKALLDFICKVAPKDINLGGQKDNPFIIVTPEEKALMEGKVEPDPETSDVS